MQQRRPVRRALLSVSDKAGIVEFAQALSARGVELLSTGGTARLLAEKGLPVTEVSDYTGFPEMMDGRVKTLHPKVHGGILGRRGQDDTIMEEHQIQPIDMVVVNLYRSPRPLLVKAARWKMRLRTSISAARRWCALPPRTIKMSQSW